MTGIIPPKLFVKRSDVPIQSLMDMDFAPSRETPALVYKEGHPDKPHDDRKTTLKMDIKPQEYPEVCKALLNIISIWDKALDPADFVVSEFNYLKYGVGDLFKKHKDRLPDNSGSLKPRLFSTSTIIKVSDDLKGGEFRIWPEDESTTIECNLDVGDTIFFSSQTMHEVNTVYSGNREVLVAWITHK